MFTSTVLKRKGCSHCSFEEHKGLACLAVEMGDGSHVFERLPMVASGVKWKKIAWRNRENRLELGVVQGKLLIL